MEVVFTWRHERVDRDDWALQGTEPATLTTILSLVAELCTDSANYLAAAMRCYLGPRKASLPE